MIDDNFLSLFQIFKMIKLTQKLIILLIFIQH